MAETSLYLTQFKHKLKQFVLQQHNPAFHPAGLVGSGTLRNHTSKPNLKSATNRTRTGLIASQKAVHAHPDHASSWAVLAASVTAHNVATAREGLGTEKNGLGARLSQFVELTGIYCFFVSILCVSKRLSSLNYTSRQFSTGLLAGYILIFCHAGGTSGT